MKKFFEIAETVQHKYYGELHRIKALQDMPNHGVKAGDLGGLIQYAPTVMPTKKTNLAQDGSWISHDAIAIQDSLVSGGALVSDRARILERARISGFGTVVSGDACISGRASISDKAKVTQTAFVTDSAQVWDSATVSGGASVSGHARVSGENTMVISDANVIGHAHVATGAVVVGGATIGGEFRAQDGAWVGGSAAIFSNAYVGKDSYVTSSRDVMVVDGLSVPACSVLIMYRARNKDGYVISDNYFRGNLDDLEKELARQQEVVWPRYIKSTNMANVKKEYDLVKKLFELRVLQWKS